MFSFIYFFNIFDIFSFTEFHLLQETAPLENGCYIKKPIATFQNRNSYPKCVQTLISCTL